MSFIILFCGDDNFSIVTTENAKKLKMPQIQIVSPCINLKMSYDYKRNKAILKKIKN